LSEKDEKKIKDALTDYGERRIMLSEFRKVVEELETTYRQK
jgi:N-acetylglutamate synthase-like GNAT family acetyltransferase